MFYNLEKINPIGRLFNIVESCRGISQGIDHHPEGDVFNHSIQVFNRALKESTDIDLLVAALVHDVGKKIDNHGHEQYGLDILNGLISEKTTWLIKHHMRFWYFILGDMKKRSRVLELSSHQWFTDLSMLARWDKMGRNPNYQLKYDRLELVDQFKKTIKDSE